MACESENFLFYLEESDSFIEVNNKDEVLATEEFSPFSGLEKWLTDVPSIKGPNRHESSDEEEDSSDEHEDSSAEEEDSSDEETVSFDALAHELIQFYQRYGIDHYWTRYGAVGARGKGCRGGGDFCLFFNKNGAFVKAYEESKKKFVFDEYELDIRRQPFKDLFRL
ncbi:Oidioi.mRNA.OKI2018_I69.chr1.g2638.t1.cds [Oikopleura dioica]|uniref:Oidioi.mRNA.OKI2018_I69.chr1.g2638.t1.cds n=1 Tax=Oikopleura dioica TaxID=34765 RepID=A0ABN7SRP4_OIKDI|nr:Oidioi.mRNA.OKI2018_I69.chr1.g2638.t1.cds [Oikopleura dioica]